MKLLWKQNFPRKDTSAKGLSEDALRAAHIRLEYLKRERLRKRAFRVFLAHTALAMAVGFGLGYLVAYLVH